MTKQRYDNHSTEFGLWLRQQKEIDSNLGFVTSNLDFIWRNYKTGDWILLEEKRYGGHCDYSQQQTLEWLDQHIIKDNKYHGLHKLVFEKTNPENGKMWLDGNFITKIELLKFLKFERR